MPNGVDLYGAYLFGNAYASTIIKSFNNAPVGAGGLDADAAGRIGGKNITTGARVKGSNKNRVQGICCGITAGWMAAVLGGNSEATDHSAFQLFFMGPLRYQGAYVKDFKGNSGSIKTLFAGFKLGNSNPANNSVTMIPEDIGAKLPTGTFWAGYIACYAHAVGVACKNFRYFVMEPNAGLFEFQNKGKCVEDLKLFLTTRRDKNDPGQPATMDGYFYNG